jgi:hypothetical protein
MTLLRHYGTTYNNHHHTLQNREAEHLRALETRLRQDIEVMTDYLKLYAIAQ